MDERKTRGERGKMRSSEGRKDRREGVLGMRGKYVKTVDKSG